MRCMHRNTQLIYYAQYTGDDANGNPLYGAPVPLRASVYPFAGRVAAEMFGLLERYDDTMVLGDPNAPVCETSILWIGTPPTEPYNYIVRRVLRSINSVSYALSKVAVSE